MANDPRSEFKISDCRKFFHASCLHCFELIRTELKIEETNHFQVNADFKCTACGKETEYQVRCDCGGVRYRARRIFEN